MRLTLASLVIFAAGFASASPRPVVESIEPGSGPPAGGTTVTIRGENLGNTAPPMTVRPLCTPCPAFPPEVLFGGKHGDVQSYTHNEIVVKTPPNAGGVYDVQVGGSYVEDPVILPRAFQYGTNSFAKILVPLVADRIPGGYGSIWSTELIGRNDNDRSIAVTQYVEGFPPIITPPRILQWGEARTTFRPELDGDAAFLYHEPVLGGLAPPTTVLAFSLRVRDLSRQADSWEPRCRSCGWRTPSSVAGWTC